MRRVDSLPPLAWTAIVTGRRCEITHGPRVEVSETATAPLPLNRSELFVGAVAAIMERYAGWAE